MIKKELEKILNFRKKIIKNIRQYTKNIKNSINLKKNSINLKNINLKTLCATDEACGLVGMFFFTIGITLLQIINIPIDLFSTNYYIQTNRTLGIIQFFSTIFSVDSVIRADRYDLWWLILYNTIWLLKNI